MHEDQPKVKGGNYTFEHVQILHIILLSHINCGNQLNKFLKTLSTVFSILTVCIMYTPVLYINNHAHFSAQFLAQRVLMLCMKHERRTRQKEEIQGKNGRTNRKLEIVKEKGRGTFKIRRKSGDQLMWFTATAATVELRNFRALQQSVSLLH